MAKMSTLSDTFPGTSLDGTLWQAPYGTVSVAEGIVTVTDIAESSSYSGFTSVDFYDLTSSQLAAFLVSPGTAEPATQAVLQVQDSTGNYQLTLIAGDGQLLGQVNSNGSYSQGGWTTYTAASMRWVRIREAGGTVYFEYASEWAGTWTTLWSVTDPFPLTALQAVIQHGAYSNTDPQTSSQWGMVNPQAAVVLSGASDTCQLGQYLLEVNEYNSTAAMVVTSDGAAPDFAVPLSAVDTPGGGAPGAGPDIIYGNHWGSWSGAFTGLPRQVSGITGGGAVTTSAAVTVSGVAAGDLWDVNYDIWFNASSAGNQSGSNANNLEMMIWPVCSSGAYPTGSLVASAVTIQGIAWDVYYGSGGDGECLSYRATSAHTSVTGLDIGVFAADAVARGYLPSSWYLIDVEFGLEIWAGGASLAVNSFSVTVNNPSAFLLFMGAT